MRRLSSSWSKTFAKLGFKSIKKPLRRVLRERRFESLEQRLVFSTTHLPTRSPSGNDTDKCPCNCANAQPTSGGSAMTQKNVAGLPMSFNSETLAHPVLTFNQY